MSCSVPAPVTHPGGCERRRARCRPSPDGHPARGDHCRPTRTPGHHPAETLAAVRRALLVKVAPGVYASPASPATVARHRAVGLLALGPDAVLSHDAAAELHGFDRTPLSGGVRRRPRARRGRRMPFTVHTTLRLGLLDRVTVDGFRCTSATRTVLDLARARVGRLRLEAAIDSAVRSGSALLAYSPIASTSCRGPGRWGTPLLEDAARRLGRPHDAGTALPRADAPCGPPATPDEVVHRHGDRLYARVDFYFEEAGVVVEVSGCKGHSSPSERARDAQRRNELQEAGRSVYEYTWETSPSARRW